MRYSCLTDHVTSYDFIALFCAVRVRGINVVISLRRLKLKFMTQYELLVTKYNMSAPKLDAS